MSQKYLAQEKTGLQHFCKTCSAFAGIWAPLVAALGLSQQMASAYAALDVMYQLLVCHLNAAQVAICFMMMFTAASMDATGSDGYTSTLQVKCWKCVCCAL